MKNLMVGLIVIGILLILTGLYFAIFTNIATKGTDGILIIAGAYLFQSLQKYLLPCN